MPVAIYPALVATRTEGGYRAELVDFPGVAVEETGMAELLRAARERLGRELASLEQDAREWPEPTPVERLSDRLQAGAALLLVDVQVEETPVRVNISIGERLLRRLDEAAETSSMTRSGYIAAAVRQRLGEGDPSRGEGAASAQRLREEMSELGRRVNEALGPESAFGRTLNDLDARALDGLKLLAERLGTLGGRKRTP